MLADTGHGTLPWVYSGSMVSVLVFAIVKGFAFTKTTLMASSWLHDRLFDKVQPRELPTQPVPRPTGFVEHLLLRRTGPCAGLQGQTLLAWNSPSSLRRVS